MAATERDLHQRQMASGVARWRGSLLGLALLTGGVLLLTGCPKKPEVLTAEPRVAAPAPAPAVKAPEPKPEVQPAPAVKPAPAPAVKAPEPRFADVYFDFDKADLGPDARQALNANVQVLRSNGQLRLTVEGHCDERGTNEYNLALGERRARAVRDYLVAAGIDATRISIISYGKERPFVLGHDESAWKLNRRGHFIVAR
jgi:peptidoglycan-associated lipoprotein